MSTPIIGGGDNARAAIAALESASLLYTDAQRSRAESMLSTFTESANTLVANAQANSQGPECP